MPISEDTADNAIAMDADLRPIHRRLEIR
jgi:hypothetical protein